MKDIRPALRAFLLADTAIAVAIATRIYPLKMPQGMVSPSLVYNRISNVGFYHMKGPSSLSAPRIQLGSWAQSADVAAANAILVKQRISGYKGPMGSGDMLVTVQAVFFDSERDLYDETSLLYGTVQDYFVYFEEF